MICRPEITRDLLEFYRFKHHCTLWCRSHISHFSKNYPFHMESTTRQTPVLDGLKIPPDPLY